MKTKTRVLRPSDQFILPRVTLDQWNLLSMAVRLKVELCEEEGAKVLGKHYRELLEKISEAEQVYE